MIALTEHVLQKGAVLDKGLRDGVKASYSSSSLVDARKSWSTTRIKFGFNKGSTKLLTAPDNNKKLAKGTEAIYGLTLQHYVQKLTTGLVVNACPHAGDCTKVCVLDNGGGLYPRVQKSRRAKTELMAEDPYSFGVLLGHELAQVLEKEQAILFRPNVNSDVRWELVAPSLTSGELFGNQVVSYGYSKLPETLKANGGWVDNAYRVAYSWNENSQPLIDDVITFMQQGGNVAVVTNRKPHDPIDGWDTTWGFDVVDADKTDEWILEHDGVWGDLSAKGKARKLIGNSGFVMEPY